MKTTITITGDEAPVAPQTPMGIGWQWSIDHNGEEVKGDRLFPNPEAAFGPAFDKYRTLHDNADNERRRANANASRPASQ